MLGEAYVNEVDFYFISYLVNLNYKVLSIDN